jgi:hypothetical protein
MKLNDVVARIAARGFTVDCKPVADNVYAITALDANGNAVNFPNVTIGKTGNVSDVALPSCHGGKVTGLGDYPTAAIYGDLYLNHAGHPAAAEKAIAALLALPVVSTPTPEQPAVEQPAVA